MLKIVRRGKKGIFQIKGTLCGIRVRESTGTDSEPHAEAQRIKLENELLERATWGERRTASFAEAVTLYLEGRSERFIAPLLEHFGRWRMGDITQPEVSKFAQLTYPGASPQTIDRQVYTPLIAIWRVAHEAKLCGPHEFKRPKQPEREAVRFAKDEYLAKLLPECGPRLKAAVLLITFTAARASECCRVKDEEVDWEARSVLLRKTKNSKPRSVPLAPMLYEALLPLKGRQGPLFGFSQRWSLNQAIERTCKRAGVPYMSSHQVGRHAFAARLLRQGKNLKELQEAGGWSPKSLPMMAEVYGHL
jgi:integrase